MPPLAPLMPRKMLPPPTTIAISTPRSARALVTSPAMRCTTSESMPKPSSTIGERLTRELEHHPSVLALRHQQLPRRGGSRPRSNLLFAVAAVEPVSVADRQSSPILTRAKRRTVASPPSACDERADRLLLVLHDDCSSERDGLEEPVELALDDLRPGLLGLALFGGLLSQIVALALRPRRPALRRGDT